VPLAQFYEAVAQLAFTLFGLWWVVLELALDDAVTDRPVRRTVVHVSLVFLVPGVVSVASLLAVDALVVWRFVFGVGGALAAVATARFAVSAAAAAGPVSRVLWWLVCAVELGFVVVAVARPQPTLAGAALSPLTIEGTLVVTLLLLGVVAAWQVFSWHAEARADGASG
jgi:hypothetical protein